MTCVAAWGACLAIAVVLSGAGPVRSVKGPCGLCSGE